MFQQYDKLRFTIIELIRKPRKRGSRWVSGMENYPPGIGIITICLLLLLATYVEMAGGLYKYAWFNLVIVAVLLYFNFDFINIKEILNYRNTEYYKLTQIPFSQVLNDKGIRGEFYIYLLSKHLKSYHKILFNTYVPMPNGSFQEIDAILLSEEGIFVIESKNRDGFFQGDFNDKIWTQYIGSQSNEMHSPIEQNHKHRISLDYYLKTNAKLENESERDPNYYTINSLIIFAEGAQFNLTGELPTWTSVQNRKEALDYIIYELNDMKNKQLTPHDIEMIYNVLLPLGTLSEEEKKAKMEYRESMTQSGKFKRHEYKYYEPKYIDTSFWNWQNKKSIIREDGVYTELYLEDYNLWVAAPNMDFNGAKEII